MDKARISIGTGLRLAALSLALQWPAACAAQGDAAGKRSLTLASFGAVGDDRADDTRALQKAFSAAAGQCLDGEGRTYRVRGTLRAQTDFCLVNADLRQDVEPFETKAWISGDCPVEADPSKVATCGDPAMPAALPAGLDAYLNTRTLLIRPDEGQGAIRVELRNVRVDRGTQAASGSRSDAAGMWIGNAAGVVLDDVEVTGGGKGFGLIIVNSSDITAKDVWLHDLVWQPYAGDAPLALETVRKTGWNTVPIREYRTAGDQNAPHTGFHGVRVQEQLSCLMIVGSKNIVFEGLRIEGCLARFNEGDVPWQADGIGIGQSSSNIRIVKSRIADTWEAIDIVGGGDGVSNVSISQTAVVNTFGYGVKVGVRSHDITLDDSTISRTGLAGVVIYGKVRDMAVRRVRIAEVGSVFYGGALRRPWEQERAGVLIAKGNSGGPASDDPAGIMLDAITVKGGRDCRFGVLNQAQLALQPVRLDLTGCETPNVHAPR